MTEAGSALRHRRGWGGPRAEARAVHSTLCFPGPASSMAWPGLARQSQSLAFSLDSHHGLSVRLAQSQQPRPTDHRGRGLQIEVLPGYGPRHNGIMYFSTNHKGDLLYVLRLDDDL